MDEHEEIVSKELGIKKIKDERFSDFQGSIKSLGAWGGDFCMVATELSKKEVQNYFAGHGLDTVIAYKDMTLNFQPEVAAKAEAVAG